jgi:type II secretory pathway pseudopilin PulG
VNADQTAAGCPSGVVVSRPFAGGFSLLELIVVMSVTVVLTGLLLPALIQVRENANRVICSSNLRQTGLALVLYADDHSDNLPPSAYARPGGNKQEMMVAHRGNLGAWDGLGWLYRDFYCNAPEIFYCPSHKGEHFYERYERAWHPLNRRRIYTNYHYAGPLDWDTGDKRRINSNVKGETIILATDGLRTRRDFNHDTGMNVLRGDASVLWRDDVCRQLISYLPSGEIPVAADSKDRYLHIWGLLNSAE